MKVSVLRIGHRLVRDDRVTTHAALVARAFGAERIYMTGIDQSVAATVAEVAKTWGGSPFKVEVIDDWKALAKTWKRHGGKVVHLTMYGINIDSVVQKIRKDRDLLVIIGSEKVPREAYNLANYNVAIGSQPHSEIAALAIFLDRMFKGKQLGRKFDGGRLRIVPNERGKKVQEIR
ncbi:MAG: tRNA (cytidine(56)-2'-O)-methyltransferase [Nitrososphaera sp.]|nr:tRNA (cytidine(56)-2'-O)-methyltransferase [Nitrososphaera sp.]